MSYPLWKRNMRQMIRPFAIILAVLCMYHGVIIYMYDPEMMEMLNQYQAMMPEMMSAMGMNGVASNLIEFLNMYLYGFLMQLFPFIFIVLIGNSFIMRYVDTGSLACILTTPNSRKKVIFTQAVSMIFSLVLFLTVLTIISCALCQMMFPGELDVIGYLELNLSAMLLQLAVSGIVFFAACIFSETRHFYALGCGLPLFCFLCSMVANMGEKLEGLKYLSIYTLFPADRIVTGEGGTLPYHLALVGIALVLYVAGIRIFMRRDLAL